MEPVLTCTNCQAKLKLKPALLKILKEVQCSKCRKVIPIPPELKGEAAAGKSATQAVPPAAGHSGPAPSTASAPQPERSSAAPTTAGEGGRIATLENEVKALRTTVEGLDRQLASLMSELSRFWAAEGEKAGKRAAGK